MKWLFCALIGALGAGCSAPAQEQATPLQDIYDQYRAVFPEACFYKPAESTSTNGLAFTLAPMFLEARATNAKPSSQALQRTVYYGADTARRGDQLHARFTYVWRFAPESSGRMPEIGGFQGVRLTLNSRGEPVIWEVLRDRSGAELVFVAQSLENAAREQHGAPLPGRRHAIERGTNQAPKVIVARVIEDGPVPMGPMLYLDAATHSVITLICRCMPPQVKNLVDTEVYALTSAGADAVAEFGAVMEIGDPAGSSRIERVLRLPKNF
ncbi:MAG TPA: hypothetical protein VN673_05180 [Clostridia bacterium]|nr:hypothetical protein [Clostridia bacterium]